MPDVSPRVLVVDDERFYREAIAESLTEAGFGCDIAEDGAAAIAAASECDYGAVVLDIGLVDPSGVEVVEAILARHSGTRVLVLATQAEHEAVLESLRRGACDYLAKPLHDEELTLAVMRALENFRVESDWTGFRSRVCALDDRIAGMTQRAAECASDERVSVVAQAVCETVAEVLGAERSSLMLLAPARGALAVVAACGAPLPAGEMDPSAPGEGVAGGVFAGSAPLLVEDVARDERFPNGPTRVGYRSRSFAVTPIPGSEGPIGVLSATDRGGSGVLGGHDLALLRLLARQAGILLAAVSPERSGEPPSAVGEPTVDDAELARAICDVITTEIEPERLIDGALACIAAQLPASPVALYLIDDRSGALRLEGQVAGAGPTDREELARSGGLTGMVVQTGHLVATDHPEKDPRFDADLDTPSDGSVRPLICVPIRIRGKVLGAVRAFPSDPAAARARTAEVLTAAMSAAIRSVLLYRNLLDSIDELAKARRASRGQS